MKNLKFINFNSKKKQVNLFIYLEIELPAQLVELSFRVSYY